MYLLLKNQGYEPAYALAEFIDNAIHAYQIESAQNPNPENELKIHVKIYSEQYINDKLKNSIIISDNGPGIQKAKLEAALKPAKQPQNKGLSEFGIGMKAAAVWFADNWTLETKPLSESNKLTTDFNLENLLNSGSSKIQVQEQASIEKNYTKISLKNIRKPIDPKKYQEIKKDITEIYQRFISRERISIYFSYDEKEEKLIFENNNEVLVTPVYETIKGQLYAIGAPKTWSVPIEFVMNGHLVTGDIMLLKEGSYVTNPGLVLFRNGRVIHGTTRTPYIPNKLFKTGNKYGRQRIYGELFLDGQPISYTKDKFEFNEEHFFAQIEATPGMHDLQKQAQAYRTKETPKVVATREEAEKEQNIKPPHTKPKPTAPHNPTTPQGGTAQPTSPATNQGQNNSDQPPPSAPTIQSFLKSLGEQTNYIGLKDIIDESVRLYTSARYIGTALCLRIILEQGILNRIKDKHPNEYQNYSADGIHTIFTKLKNEVGQLGPKTPTINKIFHYSKDQKVVQAIKANGVAKIFDSIILLNSISHGNYKPNKQEIDTLVANTQPLLEWAYCKN
ncbi:ATP-binding protein [Paludibacterium paludis]|nr:ATP-binding protein [Paludibacterium paludis]